MRQAQNHMIAAPLLLMVVKKRTNYFFSVGYSVTWCHVYNLLNMRQTRDKIQ
jgi:hypothetical protein